MDFFMLLEILIEIYLAMLSWDSSLSSELEKGELKRVLFLQPFFSGSRPVYLIWVHPFSPIEQTV